MMSANLFSSQIEDYIRALDGRCNEQLCPRAYVLQRSPKRDRDNVRNQTEHLILLLANIHIRLIPKSEPQNKLDDRAVDALINKLFKNYKAWRIYLGRKRTARPKGLRIPRMPHLHDFQFFNTQRLSELYEKEVRFLMQTHQKNQVKDTIEVDEPEDIWRSIDC